MAGALLSVGVVLWGVVVMQGCVAGPLDAEPVCDGAVGDVVITEVHPNPDGSDGAREYIELYNATRGEIDLEGWLLIASRIDGSSPKEHRFENASIGPGSFFVLGNALGESPPAPLDYAYGDSIGNLRNADGALSLLCGELEVDHVSYAESRDGRALQLDGTIEPGAEANDDPSNWCLAPDDAIEFAPGNFGTPGASNLACAAPPVPSPACTNDDGTVLGPPEAGDASITEWMPNPLGEDASLEWVEVELARSVDLTGLQLGPAADALSASPFQQGCFPVDAGAKVVFGAGPAAAPRVDADLSFSLGNNGPRALALAVEGVVLDQLSYEGSVEGVAWQRDASSAICLAVGVTPYDDIGNLGTPGLPNPPCPPILGDQMCLEDGVPRMIRSPRPGQAQITEWMANPSAVDNRLGEWVEVRFDASVDLNGLIWSDAIGQGAPVGGEACIPVTAGAYALFARNADPEDNGGLPPADAALDISLNNRDEVITLSVGGEVLDSVAYGSSRAGVAQQVDTLGQTCDAVDPYGDGDLGSPGAANHPCL